MRALLYAAVVPVKKLTKLLPKRPPDVCSDDVHGICESPRAESSGGVPDGLCPARPDDRAVMNARWVSWL